MTTTAAHDQPLTLHLITHVPAHEPRAEDPHYRLFEAARRRMRDAGLLKCVIGDQYCSGPVELHHSHVEYSLINIVDPGKVARAFGLHLDDQAFQEWIESPGNLEALCVTHHRTHLGVHVLPGPFWEPLRYLRAGAAPPAQFVPATHPSPPRR
jgi:hypothetical protein